MTGPQVPQAAAVAVSPPSLPVLPAIVQERKDTKLDELSKAANLLTTTILNSFPENARDVPISPNLFAYTHLIQATREYYSPELHAALTTFARVAQHAYAQLRLVGDHERERIIVLHHEVEVARDRLTEAIQAERTGVPKPLPLVTVSLGFEESRDAEPHFVASIRNISGKRLMDWAVQLEVPPIMVTAATIGTYVESMSDKRRAVFRTSPKFAEQYPLWDDEPYAYKIPYHINEAIQGVRTLTVRATAYVAGEFQGERTKRVEELTGFWAPAVVARREAMQNMTNEIARLGDAAAEEILKKGGGKK